MARPRSTPDSDELEEALAETPTVEEEEAERLVKESNIRIALQWRKEKLAREAQEKVYEEQLAEYDKEQEKKEKEEAS